VLGYTFKPVSFWYCQRADGTLRAIVAEVNNTFGERHCYLLDAPRYGQPARPQGVPRLAVLRGARHYRFASCGRIARRQPTAPWRASTTTTSPGPADAHQRQRHARAPGPRQPAPRALGPPGHDPAVIARIHWQALRLWLKRVGFSAKPAAPAEFVTP
jgi:uncharacterized protein